MKLLLTGGKGNLGSNIIKHCSHEIISVSREDWVNFEDLLEGVDIVVHAAYDLKNKLFDCPNNVLDSNLISTTRLLEAMNKKKISRLIFLSTCAVYGESMRTHEDHPCYPLSINGLTKLLNEKIIEEYCQRHKIKFEIYRVFNSYGGNDQFSIFYHIRQAIKESRAFKLNNSGISQRDFIHVEDVAKIVLRLIDTAPLHNCLNIGTGVSTKISYIIDKIRERCPQLEIQNQMVKEAEYSRGDITRLKSIINYRFLSVDEYIKKSF
jgi:nucleoside-diphosphate-sugar epimerase